MLSGTSTLFLTLVLAANTSQLLLRNRRRLPFLAVALALYRPVNTAMGKRRKLSPESVWDYEAVLKAFEAVGAAAIHVPRMYR
jgi:hypothetical protein